MHARTVQQLFDLTGKTALVTGGSRGLGLQMAHALGEAGARVMLSARKADELEHAVARLQDAGIDARWTAADCSSEADGARSACMAISPSSSLGMNSRPRDMKDTAPTPSMAMALISTILGRATAALRTSH